jgi:alkylhydroperoxidase/carboxymuconolactone decarboxylase family protein YurZ
MATLEDTLAKIALRDERFIHSLGRVSGGGVELDERTCELVKLAALIGIEGSLASYVATVQAAQAAGASETEIVDTLVAVLPSAGVVRASSAAPKIALALGYELNPALQDDALEAPEIGRS